MSAEKAETAIIVGGLVVVSLVAVYLLKKAAGVTGGILSGNNALTNNQTDAQGNTVTAYQNAGVFGTAGAAANTASGGVLASAGEYIGGKLADWFQTDPLAGQTTTNTNNTYTPVNGWQAHGAR
jgi:hypothetical protein